MIYKILSNPLNLNAIKSPPPRLVDYAHSVSPLSQTLIKESLVLSIHGLALLVNFLLDRGRSKVNDANRSAEALLAGITDEKKQLTLLAANPAAHYPDVSGARVESANQQYLRQLDSDLSAQTRLIADINQPWFSNYTNRLIQDRNSSATVLQQLASSNPNYNGTALFSSPGVSPSLTVRSEGLPSASVPPAVVSEEYAANLQQTVRLAAAAESLTNQTDTSLRDSVLGHLQTLQSLEQVMHGLQGSLTFLSVAASSRLPVPLLLGAQAAASLTITACLTWVGRYRGTHPLVVAKQINVARSISGAVLPLLLYGMQESFGLSGSSPSVNTDAANQMSQKTLESVNRFNSAQTSVVEAMELYSASLPTLVDSANGNMKSVLAAASSAQLNLYANVSTRPLNLTSVSSGIYFLNSLSPNSVSSLITASPGASSTLRTPSIGPASLMCVSKYPAFEPYSPDQSELSQSRCELQRLCSIIYSPSCEHPNQDFNRFFNIACSTRRYGPSVVEELTCGYASIPSQDTTPIIRPGSIQLRPDQTGFSGGSFLGVSSQAAATIPFGLGDKLQFSMPTVPADTLLNANFGNGISLSIDGNSGRFSLDNNGVSVLNGSSLDLFSIQRINAASALVQIGQSSVTVPMAGGSLSPTFTATMSDQPLPLQGSVTIGGLSFSQLVTYVCNTASDCATKITQLTPRLEGIQFFPTTPSQSTNSSATQFNSLSVTVPSVSPISYAPQELNGVPTAEVVGVQLSAMSMDIGLQTLLFAVLWYFSIIPSLVSGVSTALSVVDPHERLMPNPTRVIARTLIAVFGHLIVLFHLIRAHQSARTEPVTDIELHDLGNHPPQTDTVGTIRTIDGSDNEVEEFV
jgi:hypothetical protein